MPRKYTCSNADRTSGRGSEEIPRPAVDFLRRSDLPCQELVNGSNVEPVVYTVCPGPIWPGRTGPVAGGQTMSRRPCGQRTRLHGAAEPGLRLVRSGLLGYEAEHAQVHGVRGGADDPDGGPGAL